MSVAWYIVLQRGIPGFDPRVNGKILARTGNVLEALAKHAGVVPLMEFFSAVPDELVEFAEDHGLNVEDIPVELPTEKWFSPEEGLKTVKALKQALTEQQILGVSKIMDDLTEFEEVLNVASANQVPWHLAVDF